jgi:hypothetical protein
MPDVGLTKHLCKVSTGPLLVPLPLPEPAGGTKM